MLDMDQVIRDIIIDFLHACSAAGHWWLLGNVNRNNRVPFRVVNLSSLYVNEPSMTRGYR